MVFKKMFVAAWFATSSFAVSGGHALRVDTSVEPKSKLTTMQALENFAKRKYPGDKVMQENLEILSNVFKHFERFSKLSNWHRFVKFATVDFLPTDAVFSVGGQNLSYKEIRKLFMMFAGPNGFLEHKSFGLNGVIGKDVFDAVDLNQDGKITITEAFTAGFCYHAFFEWEFSSSSMMVDDGEQGEQMKSILDFAWQRYKSLCLPDDSERMPPGDFCVEQVVDLPTFKAKLLENQESVGCSVETIPEFYMKLT